MFYYVTGNKDKIRIAAKYLPELDIAYEITKLDVVEIQSDNPVEVAMAKAEEAYKQIQKPVLVNDHGWAIPGLNGFPGAYMKYMNEWLTPQDFLNLTKDIKNRTIILTEIICFKDATRTKSFTQDHPGVLLKTVQGDYPPCMAITSLTGDGISVAQKFANNESGFDEYSIWKEFSEWYKK